MVRFDVLLLSTHYLYSIFISRRGIKNSPKSRFSRIIFIPPEGMKNVERHYSAHTPPLFEAFGIPTDCNLFSYIVLTYSQNLEASDDEPGAHQRVALVQSECILVRFGSKILKSEARLTIRVRDLSIRSGSIRTRTRWLFYVSKIGKIGLAPILP